MAKHRIIAPKHVRKFADRMRHKLSKHEMMFLRRLTLANVASFDFQVRIGFYIADFIFPEKMLVLELDGPGHDAEHDAKRDRFLNSAGFIVWRVPNSQAALWPLTRIREYERPQAGRGYVDAIQWANKKHADSTARSRGKVMAVLAHRSQADKDESKERFYKRLIAKTESCQRAEKERREMFAAEREGRPVTILKGAGRWRRKRRR